MKEVWIKYYVQSLLKNGKVGREGWEENTYFSQKSLNIAEN